GDVDPREILAAHRVRGPIDFARSKRKPTDRTAAAHRYAEVASADERDKRGRVHGSLPRRTRHPAPTLLDERPATIVERRKAPWRIVDPCPSPRIDPCPMAVAIRRPTRRNPPRNPHVAVIGHCLPCSELVEILVADDFRRNVTGSDRPLVAALPRQCPTLESFRGAQREVFVIAQIGAVKAERLPCGDPISGALAVRFAFAIAHGDERGAI